MNSRTVEDRIDQMIQVLSAPLTAKEIADGWTEKSKAAMLEFFEKLRDSIRSGDKLPPLSISRGMDFWGITGGDLLEEGAVISNELRAREQR
jgi:hypothetical protein